jgi:beta-glucosidase-like glycosyl hydrolase
MPRTYPLLSLSLSTNNRSYNAVNGVPTCASSFLQSALRGVWNFTGYITSDTGALEDIYQQHKYVATEIEAAAAALVNGTTDVCSGYVYHDQVLPALAAGLVTQDNINAALTRTLRLRFQMGLFDPIEDQPYWNYTAAQSSINTSYAQSINWLHTLSGLVLLKNAGATLPLPTGKTVAVIGPHATSQLSLLGAYLGQICPDPENYDNYNCVTDVVSAITAANVGGQTVTAPGCNLTTNSSAGVAQAVGVAKGADVIVMMVGINYEIEGESLDRTSIDLPSVQHSLIATMAALGKPLVVVLLNGGMVDITPEKANPGVGAIVEAGYPASSARPPSRPPCLARTTGWAAS